MKDIATRAGVTKATVSMVLSNDERITEKTRDRILKIVKELNYYPNESAQKLALGKSNTIAVIGPRYVGSLMSTLLHQLEDRSHKTGKYMHGIQPYSTLNQTRIKEELLRKILYGHKADAVIMVTVKPGEEIVKEYLKNKVPLILVENKMKGTISIQVNNTDGAFRATEYLVKKYGRKIGLIVGNTKPREGEDVNPSAGERLKGYRAALKANNIEFDESYIGLSGSYAFEDGVKILDEFLKKRKRPRSIFCAAGDEVAVGVMDRAKKLGIRIPGDLAVIGYDDILESRVVTPELTTIRQRFDEMGRLAFDMTIDAIEGRIKTDTNILLDPELVLRESA
jgi:LacI family transcriptional regulator